MTGPNPREAEESEAIKEKANDRLKKRKKRMAPGRSLALTGFALLFPLAAEAIYEDQVGQLDWRRDHVG